MLTIIIPAQKGFNESTQRFVSIAEQTLTLEHSLVSISKWESKIKKPFLINDGSTKSEREILEYIKCMTITPNVPDIVYNFLTTENIIAIKDYMGDPMTATTFSVSPESQVPSRRPLTSEEIYWQMINFNIPIEFQKWHINRLLTLIRVCNIKAQPEKQMSQNEIINRNKALNAARRKRLNSNG